jgi:hypothetical protein
MTSQAVNLTVVAPIPIDCKFWIEDDGWSGVCDSLGVTIHAANFEEAKKKMEAALRERIELALKNESSKHDESAEFRRSA